MTGSGKKDQYVASGERASVVAQAVNAYIASRARHFLSPTASMWTMFIRALMGRRVDDRVTSPQVTDDSHEDCFLADSEQNASQLDIKSCNKKSNLMRVHRRPGYETEQEESTML